MRRLFSIITLCLMASVALVSCQDTDDINTGKATVAFGQAEYSIKENKGIFNIPIVVSGEQNGPIRVSIEVTSNGANCKEDVNYMITSKEIIIPAKKKQVNVEIKAIDDRIINDDRQFSMHIASASGASVSETNATTKVTLTDNDDIPYERMAGVWTVTAINKAAESGKDEPITWDMKLDIVDDDDPSYGSLITSSPWAVWDGSTPTFDEEGNTLTHQMTFHHNASTGKTTVDMKMGSIMFENLNFGTIQGIDFSNASIYSATEGINGSAIRSGTITGVVNENFDEIKFSNPLLILVYPETSTISYLMYGYFTDITLKLKK